MKGMEKFKIETADMEEQEELIDLSEEPKNTVPLFIKKLWSMVNDIAVEDIIGWNDAGDSFIIHDQFQFSMKVLPHYFKHNNMASFVRQLNFYNFRKVPNVKNQIQFAHNCFIKDVPQILVFIRRKHHVNSKQTVNANDEQVMQLLKEVTEMKTRHSQIDKEISLLRRENHSLWKELHSLQVKYDTQSTTLNKLIHFLITYIHTRQTTFSNQNIKVPRDVNPNMLKSGPTILELDYTDPKDRTKKITEPYSILQPSSSSIFPKKNTQSLKEILSLQEPRQQTRRSPQKKSQASQITYSVKLPRNQLRKMVTTTDMQNKLLEILKESEQLSVENSSGNFPVTERVSQQIQSNQPIIESSQTVDDSIANSDSSKMTSFVIPNTNYIVEYPEADSSKGTRQVISEKIPQEKPNSSNRNTSQSSSKIFEHQPSLSKMGSIGTKKKKSSISLNSVLKHPKKIMKKSTADAVSYSLEIPEISPDKTVLSKIQSPSVSILNESQTDIPLEEIFPGIQSQGENLACETEIADLVGSNENQTNETFPIIESPSDQTVSNYSTISQLTPNEILENDIDFPDLNLEPLVESPSDETSASKGPAQFSILENPRQNLGLYLDTTQEELNMLQDILNNLNSKEFSDILGGVNTDRTPEAICSSADSESRNDSSPAGLAAIEPSDEFHLASNPSICVDDFFNPQFMVSDD